VFRIGVRLCAVALGSREASADDREHTRSVHLHVVRDAASGGCPGAAEVAAAANRALGRDRVRTDDADAREAELRISVAFSREPGGFGATVREAGALDAERTIRTAERSCDTLTSALGATIALSVCGPGPTPGAPAAPGAGVGSAGPLSALPAGAAGVTMGVKAAAMLGLTLFGAAVVVVGAAPGRTPRFRGGALEQEREVLRVSALGCAGRAEEASAAAAAFVESYPDSPYAATVQPYFAVRSPGR
jgi:hypothetical protein